jgi:hypothetical protein
MSGFFNLFGAVGVKVLGLKSAFFQKTAFHIPMARLIRSF